MWKSQNFVKIIIINIQKYCQNLKLFQSKLWTLSGFYNIVINVKFSRNCWIFWKLLFCQKVKIFQNSTTFSQMLILSVASLKFFLFFNSNVWTFFQNNRNFLILKIWNYIKFLGIYQFTTRSILYFVNEHCNNFF